MAWSGCAGESDLENRSLVSAKARFRIGSVSKLITAAMAMRLYDRAALDLDAPVQKYLPSFPDKGAPITARLLLGHLGGIRHYGPNEYINRQRYTSIADTLKIVRDEPLSHPPRTRYLYSSYGFNLLGAVIEAASGADFASTIQKHVCEPVGMNSTTIDENDRIIPFRTRFYSTSGERIVNSPYTDLSDRWPSGGMLSTTEDLVRFGAAHLSGEFLKPETRRLMFTSQSTSDGKETGTGLAWRIGLLDGRRIYHHGGDSIGGRAFLLLLPERGTAVALLANFTSARFAEKEAAALADAIG